MRRIAASGGRGARGTTGGRPRTGRRIISGTPAQRAARTPECGRGLFPPRRRTKAGHDGINRVFARRHPTKRQPKWVLPPDIRRRLEGDSTTWKHFQRFPESYKRIRIGGIAAARHRRAVFEQRLGYFLKMTAQNKRFGMVQ